MEECKWYKSGLLWSLKQYSTCKHTKQGKFHQERFQVIFSWNLPAKSYYIPSKHLKSAAIKTKIHSSAQSQNSINVLLLFFTNEHYCSSSPSISFLLNFMYNNAVGIIPHQSVQIQEHLCHQLTLGSSGTSWSQACHSRKTPYA